jgi:hypothetical protein
MTRQAQIEAEAEAGYGWTTEQAEGSSVEVDYEAEM